MFMPFDAHICFIKSMLIRNVHSHCPSLWSFVCIVEMKFVASPLIKSIKTKDLSRTLISLLPLGKLKKICQIHND
jgi:hypothetical protein